MISEENIHELDQPSETKNNSKLLENEKEQDFKDEPIDEEMLETSDKNDEVSESLRIQIKSFPKFANYVQVKKFLQKVLPSDSFRKIKLFKQTAFVSFKNASELEAGMLTLNGMKFKGTVLTVKRVGEEPESRQADVRNNEEHPILKSVVEIVSPLAGLSYQDQLASKMEESKRTTKNLMSQLKSAGIRQVKHVDELLMPILPSPITREYRNKCEFTIGRRADGEICVGFVANRMSEGRCIVVPIDECTIFRENTRRIVHACEKFVKESGFPPFDEFQRIGFWKTLTVRDFIGDCMLIFTVHPWKDADELEKVKQAVVQRFIQFKSAPDEEDFRVTSIYWQTVENASDTCVPEHLAGVPYVYEYALGCTFRISPATFFQTNTRGLEVLYTAIGDALRLPKIVDENQSEVSQEPILLLDICCGAGTISLCLMKRLEEAKKVGKFNGKCRSIGIELVEDAIKDAKINIKENGMDSDSCHYVSGQAENIFRSLKYYIPPDMDLGKTRVMGILDPPRAGMNDKVIIGCRNLKEMKHLIYVSCDPKAATKNLVDLCRPTSRKYEGEPFQIARIQPVDLFPQTRHFEWIVELIR
uniref:tRNA (uracil(54)-C(5))-methyltransferase n=1 Tax=Acrobeloides nanus TaxID=290746 RepID=A0A914DFU5_9BILA